VASTVRTWRLLFCFPIANMMFTCGVVGDGEELADPHQDLKNVTGDFAVSRSHQSPIKVFHGRTKQC